MTSEALQNPYFVRLYCKNIDKIHSLTEPNDKIQFHGNYFFKKGGGGNHFGKGGGGTDPLFPPPPKSALDSVRGVDERVVEMDVAPEQSRVRREDPELRGGEANRGNANQEGI